MANGVYQITDDFEKELGKYTGAPYVVTLDNMSNALFLALYYEKNVKGSITGDTITIPNRTYPSVPCEIIHAGLKVDFSRVGGEGEVGDGGWFSEGGSDGDGCGGGGGWRHCFMWLLFSNYHEQII